MGIAEQDLRALAQEITAGPGAYGSNESDVESNYELLRDLVTEARLAGIREAIAECTELFSQGAMAGHMLLALEALLHNAKHPSPPSGGEKKDGTT